MAMTAAAIGGGAALGGSVIGGLMQGSENKKFRAQMQANIDAALREYDALGVPPDLSAKLLYKEYEQAGILTPELEQEIKLQTSNLSQIKDEGAGKQAQIEALQKLQQASTGGLRPEDRAAFNQIRQQVGQEDEAKRQQIMQQMAARGQAGSGADLIAQLQSAQAGTNQMASAGDQISAQASQRALQALAQYGTLGSNVRSTDLDVEKTKAQALDEMSRMNLQNSRDVQQRNIAAQNAARSANLASKQSISSANTGMYNTELQRENQAKADAYQRQFELTQAKANARVGANSALMGMGANQSTGAQIASGLGQSVGVAANAYNQYGAQQAQQDYYNAMADKAKASSPNYSSGSGATSSSNNTNTYGNGH